MKEYLQKLPKEVLDLLKACGDIASANKMRAYLVGGCVRDLLLGRPNLDLDIVIEGSGIEFAEKLSCCFNAKLVRHRRFGTATLILKPHLKIDIATSRRELYPNPAHLPVVSPGSLRDDLFRRDFTINAMALSIMPDDFGRLIDFFKGKEDLNAQKLRILHPLSFIDDPTRILRAIRFSTRYDFPIEGKTLKILKEAVRLKMLEKVEPQRLRDDLMLILKEEDPIKEIKLIQRLCGFGFISKKLKVNKTTYALLGSVRRQIASFKNSCPQRRQLDVWLMYLMGLINSLSPKDTAGLCKRFALRSGEAKRILNFKSPGRNFLRKLSLKVLAASKVYSLLEPLSYEVILLIKASHNNKTLHKHIRDFFCSYNGTRISINGQDLRSFGISPGPRYQEIFSRVLNAKLDGKLTSKQEELEFVRHNYKKR